MTDQEIIQGLIARDDRITRDFFFVLCRPLFLSIIRKVFDFGVKYDELVNELYLYLMEDDARKLRNFKYRSSVYQWLKVVAVRFFIKRREELIEKKGEEPLYEGETVPTTDGWCAVGSANNAYSAKCDLQRLFSLMPNKRYVYVIQQLVIDDCEPEKLAEEMGINVANLYNIKRRAMDQLTQVALNDIKKNGKK